MDERVIRIIEKMVRLADLLESLGPEYHKFSDRIAAMADEIEAVGDIK